MKAKLLSIIVLCSICQIYFFHVFAQQEKAKLEVNSLTESSIPVVPGSKGDVDGNGAIEIVDLIRARDISIGRLSNPGNSEIFAGDINSDGSVNRDDVERIRDILLLKTVPPPTIFGINPTSAKVGDQVTIEGAGFGPIPSNNIVTFGGVHATVVSASTTTLTVIVPAGATSGEVTVTVGGQTSNSVDFQIMISEDAPFIARITPASALRGQEVTIEGERFGSVQGNSEVRFGGSPAENDDIISWSDIEIMAKVPTNAFPGILTVTVNGLVSNGVNLNVVVVEATAPDTADIIETEDGVPFVRNVIILDFKNNVTLDQISTFLLENNLTQIGIIFRPRMIQARIDDGRNPFDLVESFEGNELLEGAFPSIISDTEKVASESYPNTILGTYNSSTATFTNPDDVRAIQRYYHFAMRTYAGHRLVEQLLEELPDVIPPDVRIAIIDGGLGDGSTNDPAEFRFRVRSPTTVGIGAAFISNSAGLTQLTKIPDGADHGTPVAGFAAGAGIVSLGTGKHVNIRPIQTSDSEGHFDPFILTGAIEIATEDPLVKVINLSLGTYRSGRLDAVNALARIGVAEVIDDEIDYAVGKGKIFVMAAGNEGVDTRLSAPSVLAPDQPRQAGDPTILNVAATERESDGTGETEERAGNTFFSPFSSNFGSKVSVAAAGVLPGVRLATNYSSNPCTPIQDCSGTSFAAPMVSGLAGEMILLGKALVQLGKKSSEMPAEKIVNIIESTADDLGTPGLDDAFGNGRINVWKALLAVVNGGLTFEVSNPEWYGFEVRASVAAPSTDATNVLIDNLKSAQIYIDDLPLFDSGNSANPSEAIILNKRVAPTKKSSGEEYIPIPNSTGATANFLTTFSITKDELAGAGNTLKRLQLRQSGKSISFPPFFEMPVDISKFAGGVPNFVAYDDYVFTIELPRVVEMKVIDKGKNLTVTDLIDGKTVKFPIGAVDDTLEISVSYPGFTPVVENTDIGFFVSEAVFITQPGKVTNTPNQNITSKIETTIHERAETGPVAVRTVMGENDPVISFTSLIDLVVPKVVGITPEGTNPGDTVRIAINVPHFMATTSNTKIKFPGNNPEVAPDQVTAGTAPNVTNVLETKIPQNFQEGPVKIIITVDDGGKVEFEGVILELVEKTNYAGTFRVTKENIIESGTVIDVTPPASRNTLPIRFTLNKTTKEEDGQTNDVFFLTGPVEIAFLNFGATVTTMPDDEGTLRFELVDQFDGIALRTAANLVVDEENQSLTGSYALSVDTGSGFIPLLESGIDANVETERADYNGVFAGRFTRQSESGDQEVRKDLDALITVEDLVLPLLGVVKLPLGFVQVDDLIALRAVDDEASESSLASAEILKYFQPGINKSNIHVSLPSLNSNGYLLIDFIIGSVSGSRATFTIDDLVFLPEGQADPDSLNNFSITYDFTKSNEMLTGTATYFLKQTKQDSTGNPGETKTAQIIYGYSGEVQSEDEDNITIVNISPLPEKGFPPISGNKVTITEVNTSYNFVSAKEGTVVLRALKNEDETMVLAEVEQPIQLASNRAGTANFSNFSIPNVGDDVVTLSIVAGLKPTGSTVFVATSSVSYSR